MAAWAPNLEDEVEDESDEENQPPSQNAQATSSHDVDEGVLYLFCVSSFLQVNGKPSFGITRFSLLFACCLLACCYLIDSISLSDVVAVEPGASVASAPELHESVDEKQTSAEPTEDTSDNALKRERFIIRYLLADWSLCIRALPCRY